MSGGTADLITGGSCPECGSPSLQWHYSGCTKIVRLSEPPAQGWQCPRCGSVYAPWVSACLRCAGAVPYTPYVPYPWTPVPYTPWYPTIIWSSATRTGPMPPGGGTP